MAWREKKKSRYVRGKKGKVGEPSPTEGEDSFLE